MLLIPIDISADVGFIKKNKEDFMRPKIEKNTKLTLLKFIKSNYKKTFIESTLVKEVR